MRTSLRVGMLIGGVGSIVLSVLQARIGLIVAPCLIIAGIICGLAVAKWLDRPSYGRQLAEGARAGLLSCGLPGFVALLSLLVAGPRDVASLAATCHFFSLDFSSLVLQLSYLGWAGIDVAALVASAITGLAFSALLVQLFAWSKTSRAARVVQQARLTAVAVQRADRANIPLLSAAPAPHSASGALVAVGASVAAHAVGAGAITAAPVTSRRKGSVQSTGTQQPNVIRMSPPLMPTPQQYMQPPAPQQYMQPPAPQQYMQPPAPTLETPASPASPSRSSRPPRGKTSAARRMESRLNQQMRQALEAWAAQEDGVDTDVEDAESVLDAPATAASKRAPRPSTFLNSDRPAKRNRKKNQTRDWLC